MSAVGAVDGFQGQEAPVAVVSITTRDTVGILVEKPRLLILLSRARDGLFINSDFKTFELKGQLFKFQQVKSTTHQQAAHLPCSGLYLSGVSKPRSGAAKSKFQS